MTTHNWYDGPVMTSKLSNAELESLRSLALHENTEQAAANREVSPQTLKNELTSAYRKLGVRSRTGAFQKLGWLRPPVTPRHR